MSALFECTAEENGLVSTPNIPDSYFDHSTAGELRTQGISLMTARKGVTYIFTIPSVLESQRNCSGSVVAFECCFEAGSADIGRTKDLFHFLSLTRDASNFRVDNNFLVEIIPTEDSCTSDSLAGGMHICCKQYTLEPINSVVIPTASFSFGVVVGDLPLLSFTHSATEFNYPQFQLAFGMNGPSVGSTFAVPGALISDQPLLLLKFVIG